MVSGIKTGRGPSTELRFWGAGMDELLELLEEEVLEDILNQVKIPKKNLKKIEKNKKQGTREKTEWAECKGGKMKEQQEKERFCN